MRLLLLAGCAVLTIAIAGCSHPYSVEKATSARNDSETADPGDRDSAHDDSAAAHHDHSAHSEHPHADHAAPPPAAHHEPASHPVSPATDSADADHQDSDSLTPLQIFKKRITPILQAKNPSS